MGMIADIINRLRRDGDRPRPEVISSGHQSRVRERAIFYARDVPLACDVENSIMLMETDPVQFRIVDPVAFRIGIDNMVATGFEMGYAAAVDDKTPARALGGTGERRGKR